MTDSKPVMFEYNEHSSNCWSSDPDLNKLFLRNVHNHMCDKLRTRGHLFLNEVLDALGLSRISKGQLEGWMYVEDRDYVLWTVVRPEDYDFPIAIRFQTEGEIYKDIDTK